MGVTRELPKLRRVMREVFGHRRLRPGQEEVIRSVLSGRDTLAIMPTGAGKSLCYQLPAFLLPGCTVVISPLVALMKDQLDSLPPALRIWSCISAISGEMTSAVPSSTSAGSW